MSHESHGENNGDWSCTNHSCQLSAALQKLRKYKVLAQQGCVESCYRIGCLYDRKFQNPKKAMKYWIKAARGKHCNALYNLGNCFQHGIGTKKDLEKAIEYYQQAIAFGHVRSMFNLGYLYRVHKRKHKEAMILYFQAAKQGHVRSKRLVGVYLLKKNHFEKAFRCFEESEGDARSHVYLGWMYANGFGVQKDYYKAQFHFEQSIFNQMGPNRELQDVQKKIMIQESCLGNA